MPETDAFQFILLMDSYGFHVFFQAAELHLSDNSSPGAG
jgi:hypothetical protein